MLRPSAPRQTLNSPEGIRCLGSFLGTGNSVWNEQWPQIMIDGKYLFADSAYGGYSQVLQCPAAPDPVATVYRTQYGINYRHTFGWPQTALGATQKWTQIRHPQETVLFTDCQYGNLITASYSTIFSGNADGTPYGNLFLDQNSPDYRHPGISANFGFFDGHVESADRKKAASQQCYIWWYGLDGL
ncbi:MAG: hypothetical protein IT448_10940 [Phycisphaerales bacterium]|nr:hypothetical protein [Phycisphaerales bacterium]